MSQVARFPVERTSDGTVQRKRAAERQRQFRARKRAGEFAVRLPAVQRHVIERLIRDGFTTWEEIGRALDASKLLSDVLSDFLDAYGHGVLKMNDSFLGPEGSD